jgi:hypothetical protein
MAPTNPARFDDRPGFRFRCARRFGYGTAPLMVRRCLERLDEEDIRGQVRILHALSTTPGTQGPSGTSEGGTCDARPRFVARRRARWEVVLASDGELVGLVKEVLGDKNADIFDGLSVDAGLISKPTYVRRSACR